MSFTFELPEHFVDRLTRRVAELSREADRASTEPYLGTPWAAFHTFRHTYASLMLAGGANVLQLSRALGHHSPAFTLTVYTHLLEGEHAPALDLACELQRPQVHVAAQFAERIGGLAEAI